MTTDKLVLNISKINISPDSTRLKYSQDERGKQVDVTVIGNDGSAAYDLTGKKIIFSEIKDGGKIIIDDEISHFIRTADNDKIGKFTYVFVDQTYQQSGEAHFEFTTDIEHVDTTINFDISIVNSAQLKPDNTSYVSSLIALEAHYRATIANTETQTQNLINSLTDKIDQAISNGQRDVANELSESKKQLTAVLDQEKDLITNWTTEFAKRKADFDSLQTDWQKQSKQALDNYTAQINKIVSKAQSQHDAIQAKADQQLKSNEDANTSLTSKFKNDAQNKLNEIDSDAAAQKAAIQKSADDQLKATQSAADSEIADVKKQLADELVKIEADKATAIKGVTDARDKAIQDATDKLTVKLQSVQADYDSWKTSTVSDFQAKLDKLTKELATDESSQTALKQAIDSAKDTISKIKDVDFTVYVHKDDLKNYYTKAELDPMIEQAGKVKSVNGVKPDEKTGNINIPAPDLSGLETKVDAKTDHDKLDKKITDNATAIKGNSDAIATKANASDVYTKAELDPKLADAGKVKTVNGIQPDSVGNITIPAPDLSGLETKADAKKALDAKADKTDLDSKADKTDVTTLQATVTGLSTKVETVVTKLSDGTLAKVAHFKASEEQKAVDWSKDDGKGGLPKIGIIDG